MEAEKSQDLQSKDLRTQGVHDVNSSQVQVYRQEKTYDVPAQRQGGREN